MDQRDSGRLGQEADRATPERSPCGSPPSGGVSTDAAPDGYRFDAFADARMGVSLFQMAPEDWLVADDQLGRFGHHSDPAIDFCIEVECCENDAYDLRANPEGRVPLFIRIDKAMFFRVGGDVGCVDAKHGLRQLEQALLAGTEAEYLERLIAARATGAV
jgi:hypothetical protein